MSDLKPPETREQAINEFRRKTRALNRALDNLRIHIPNASLFMSAREEILVIDGPASSVFTHVITREKLRAAVPKI